MIKTIIQKNESIKKELIHVVSRFFQKYGESPSAVDVKITSQKDSGLVRIQVTIKD
jgi:septum formation topological specificity factor MinE